MLLRRFPRLIDPPRPPPPPQDLPPGELVDALTGAFHPVASSRRDLAMELLHTMKVRLNHPPARQFGYLNVIWGSALPLPLTPTPLALESLSLRPTSARCCIPLPALTTDLTPLALRPSLARCCTPLPTA